MARLPSLPPKKFGTSVTSTNPAPAPMISTSSLAPTSSGTKFSRKVVTRAQRKTAPLSVSTQSSKALASSRPYKRPSLEASTTPRTRPPPAKRGNNLASSSSKPSAKIDTKQLREDRLGTLVAELITSFESADSWEEFVTAFRGHSYLADDLQDLPHPAAPILKMWQERGVPVHTKTEPWTK